jgi:hypothetical protein
MLLHSTASLATAPREPLGALSTYSFACDKPSDDTHRSNVLIILDLRP